MLLSLNLALFLHVRMYLFFSEFFNLEKMYLTPLLFVEMWWNEKSERQHHYFVAVVIFTVSCSTKLFVIQSNRRKSKLIWISSFTFTELALAKIRMMLINLIICLNVFQFSKNYVTSFDCTFHLQIWQPLLGVFLQQALQ